MTEDLRSQVLGKPEPWTAAALVVGALLWALACGDAIYWHPGYAIGDETDIIARVQRIREGAPWEFSQGWLHRSLMLASMSLWPGKLWATSVPALGAMALEGLLLFLLGRRLGGPRTGFFMVLVGLASAFTLVRSRSALSFALFPAEFLGLLWLRLQSSKPWQWSLWGALLGLLCFEYEAFIPAAGLLFVAPFPVAVSWRQRGWELLGVFAILALTFDSERLRHYFVRRKAASLTAPHSPSAGFNGIKGLLLGGPVLPYLAPTKHGVLPLWHWLLLPLSLSSLGKRAWVPLGYLGLGLLLPLMGGAPYGLPAHRAILAWPVLALLTGLGLERMLGLTQKRSIRVLFFAVLSLVVVVELGAWSRNQRAMDQAFRAPVRDLKRTADAAWSESQRLGLPLVTETHPMEGAQFRFLSGQAVSLPDATATTVLAFVQREYLPALGKKPSVKSVFQESAGSAPSYLALLSGPLARQAVEAELAFRPLLWPNTQYTVASGERVLAWLQANPKAGVWARTLAFDYLIELGVVLAVLEPRWAMDAYHEELVTAQPMIFSARAMEPLDAALALAMIRKARRIDPLNPEARAFETHLMGVQ